MIGEMNVMTEGFIFELAAAIGVGWLAFTFHWGRIVACAFVLAAWAAGAVAAPLYMAAVHLGNGSPLAAIGTMILGGVTGFLWWIGAAAAYRWVRQNTDRGTLWLPWDAR